MSLVITLYIKRSSLNSYTMFVFASTISATRSGLLSFSFSVESQIPGRKTGMVYEAYKYIKKRLFNKLLNVLMGMYR